MNCYYDDTGSPLFTLRTVLEHADTGLVRVPTELVGTTEAAEARRVSERTMRRRCKRLGIAIKVGKVWLVPVQVLPALTNNDTGTIADIKHDVEMISGLVSWPISPSTQPWGQIIPIAWRTTGQEVSPMDAGVYPMKFDRTLRLKIPEAMESALQFVARRRLQSTSSWVRQALLSELQREGLAITDTGTVRRAEEL